LGRWALAPTGKHDADPDTWAAVRYTHSQAVRRGLDARPREDVEKWYARRFPDSPAERIASFYWARFKDTRQAGRLAKEIATARGKKVGAPFSAVDDEVARRILKLDAETSTDGRKRHSQRAIARIVGVSRGAVENVLRNREGVVSHFMLDEVA
jgi:hypothetical protein